jgi:hypothetical protein
VGDRRDRDEDGADAAAGELVDRAGDGGAGVGIDDRVAPRVAGGLQADADEGLAGAGQCVAERLDDRQVGGRRGREIPGHHGGVVERQVDDRVGIGGGLAQAGRVGEVAAAHFGAQRLDGGGRGVGPGQAGDVVPGPDQFGDHGRADVAAGAGDEDAHEAVLPGRR